MAGEEERARREELQAAFVATDAPPASGTRAARASLAGGGSGEEPLLGARSEDLSRDGGAREVKQAGVAKAEAAGNFVGHGVWLWLGVIGLILTCWVQGVDNGTNYAWVTFAINQFKNVPVQTALSVAQMVILAVAKFPIAKLADVFGRCQALLVSLTFYVAGFVIMASAQNTASLATAMVVGALGNTGTQICQSIIIGDFVSTRWRGMAIAVINVPYLLNFAISPRIAGAITGPPGTLNSWRWGPGMFCILVPLCLTPITVVIAYAQRKSKEAGLSPPSPYRGLSFPAAARQFVSEVDLVGLLLLSAACLCFLLPLNLAKLQTDEWRTPWIIAMLCLSGVLAGLLVAWEYWVAAYPIVCKRWAWTLDVQLPTWINFFDFVSFYMAWGPVYTWVILTFPWDISQANYFSQTQVLSMTVFGFLAGMIGLWTRQYKWSAVAGGLIRLLGLVLALFFRHKDVSVFLAILPQILQGIGGGFLGVTLQVASQVNVKHQDMATVTAFTLLAAELGGAVGNAIVGAVQTHTLPDTYARHLPWLTDEARKNIFLSPFMAAADYKFGTPERDGIMSAYSEYFGVLLWGGVGTAIVSAILCFCMRNRKLNEFQNVTDEEQQTAAIDFGKKTSDADRVPAAPTAVVSRQTDAMV